MIQLKMWTLRRTLVCHFPHGDPHGNAYLQQLGRIPAGYKAPPVPWMQQHVAKAPQPKATKAES